MDTFEIEGNLELAVAHRVCKFSYRCLDMSDSFIILIYGNRGRIYVPDLDKRIAKAHQATLNSLLYFFVLSMLM